jgi:hypothetical protein
VSKLYRAVIFFPGPRTRWKSARNFKPGTFAGELEPDAEEVILEREFRTRIFADAWARAHLKRLKNVCAGLYVKPTLDQ